EQVLTDAHMIAISDFTLTADRQVRPVRRAQVLERERVRGRIAGDGSVPAAHERIIGENYITHFATQNGLVTRRVVDIASDAFHGTLTESHVSGHRRRAENLCAPFRRGAEPFFSVAHYLEP